MGGKKAHAIHHHWKWMDNNWTHKVVSGNTILFAGYDWPAIRRGRQVYTEVFAPCHALSMMTFNHFEAFMTKEEIKKLAASYDIVESDYWVPEHQVPDQGTGEYLARPGLVTDLLPKPFPNVFAAAASNNGKAPPDMRLISYAVEGASDYIFSLITGYNWGTHEEYLGYPPWMPELKAGLSFNPYYKGGVIAMPPPLSDGILDYEDGTPATTSQMAYDVCNFLQWETELEFDEKRAALLKAVWTVGAMSVLMHHYAQKQFSWHIYKRITYRYWKKSW